MQYEFNEIDFLDTFFQKIMTNVHSLGRNDEFLNDHEFVTEFYHNNNKIFKFVKDILRQSDTGIHDIKIRKRFDEETKETIYYPIFEYPVNEEDNFLTFYEQSSGVKSLYQQLFVYALALQEGGILVLDEFDINLHPDLLPMLVNFFEDKKKNTKDAQFIFSTHNSDIMDRLGKYRIVLVNKIDNESFLYRLDEISGDIIRNDRPLTPIYKSGKIGGKPRLQYEEAV
jgi:AAA15 family ATPase/GTPase